MGGSRRAGNGELLVGGGRALLGQDLLAGGCQSCGRED